ncbi:MAG: DUF4058 family protein [Planctomycetaceae bacterium]
MPSPFPGMDPFIESQKWRGFHTRLITALSDALVPTVLPRYVVDVEDFVYLVKETGEAQGVIGPDVHLADTGAAWREPRASGTLALAVEPVLHELPTPDEITQHYLTIRTRTGNEVVTVIEVLSPWNKRGGDGFRDYWTKRSNVLIGSANLVEIDLLRGGRRLPTREPLQPGDYYAYVTRQPAVSEAEVYAWSLRQPLPRIPIPLAADDREVQLDLEDVFTTTYDRGGYRHLLDYEENVEPPLAPDDAAWLCRQLKSWRGDESQTIPTP